jgi:hypothetical protein
MGVEVADIAFDHTLMQGRNLDLSQENLSQLLSLPLHQCRENCAVFPEFFVL